MKNQTLQKAITLLAASFPGVDFNAELYWEMLKDLPDDYFQKAVIRFIKTEKNIYPGTNPIAILREITEDERNLYFKSLPAPEKTEEEKRKIEDMRETYKKIQNRSEHEYREAMEKRKREQAHAIVFCNTGKEMMGKA